LSRRIHVPAYSLLPHRLLRRTHVRSEEDELMTIFVPMLPDDVPIGCLMMQIALANRRFAICYRAAPNAVVAHSSCPHVDLDVAIAPFETELHSTPFQNGRPDLGASRACILLRDTSCRFPR